MRSLLAATLALVPGIFTGSLLHAQTSPSAADNLTELQAAYEKLRDDFLAKVSRLPDSPENLSNGSFAADAETLCGRDLKGLSERITQQRNILREKADAIDATTISKSDKLELHGAIDAQKKPLELLQQKTSAFGDAVEQLNTSGIRSWKAVYDSYSSISGQEKAAIKLKALTDSFCQPFLPPKPKATPTPAPVSSLTSKSPNRSPKGIQWNFQTGADSPATQIQSSGYEREPVQTSAKILSFNDALNRANQGDAYAQAVVSIYYATGYKVDKDLNQAARYAILSAKQKNPLGLYRLGSMRQNGEGGIGANPQDGISLKAAAVKGLVSSMSDDPYSLTALGVMSFRGEGVAKNESLAAQLYKKAADMGYAPAQYCYSACLYNGQGVPKNPTDAEYYWRLAFDQRFPPALRGKPVE